MAKRLCLQCGRLSDQSYCPRHRGYAKQRPGTQTAQFKRLVTQLKREHVARYGDWCPGTETEPAHRGVKKFVVDHIVPLSRGGTNARRNLRVICARCNRRRIR